MISEPDSRAEVIVHDGARELDARVALEAWGSSWALILDSRSGSNESGHARNPDYLDALEHLLTRLGELSATIEDISVVSAPAMRLDPDDRRLPLGFPIRLRPGDNYHAIRKNVTEAQRSTARTPRASDAAGGNNTKRLRIEFKLPSPIAAASLCERLGGHRRLVGPRRQVAEAVLTERDREICEMRATGMTLDQIGASTGLTRERVRQIVVKNGGPSTEAVRDGRAQARKAEIEQDRQAVARDLAKHPGSSAEEVAQRLDTALSRIEASLTPGLRSLLRVRERVATRRWSRGDMVACLQAAAVIQDSGTDEIPFTGAQYDKVRVDVGGPTIVIFVKEFGSWSAAVAAAGLIGRTSRRKTPSKFSDEQLVEYVAQYLLDPNSGSRSFAGFDGWRAANAPSAPSAALLRTRFGKWAPLRSLAWSRAVESGRVTSTDLLMTNHATARELTDDEMWLVEETLRSIETSGANPADPGQYDQHRLDDAPTSHELMAAFGTWGIALGSFGWDPSTLTQTVSRQSTQVMSQRLQDFVDHFVGLNGNPPSATDWQRERDRSKTIGPWAYHRRFGSWEQALAAASNVQP